MTKKKPLRWQSRKMEKNIIFPREAWLIWRMDCLILETRIQENKCCKIEKNMIHIKCFRSVDLYSIIKKR